MMVSFDPKSRARETSSSLSWLVADTFTLVLESSLWKRSTEAVPECLRLNRASVPSVREVSASRSTYVMLFQK